MACWVRDGRWQFALATLALCSGAAACSDKNADGSTAGGATTAGDEAPPAAGASASGTSGSAGGGSTGNGVQGGGAGSSGGGSGNAGSNGDTAGSGSAEPQDAGVAACDLECAAGERCERVQVTCIQAPCPPQPMCVEAGGSGQACGSRGLGACADGQFCDHPQGADCGRSDAPGVCRTPPGACTFQYDPVCGCDGETYGNACGAAAAGVSVDHEGECGGSASLHDCDLGKVACEAPEPSCPDGQVPSVSGICYGPCVAIDECACSGPDDCPNSDAYTCHLSAGHCGPYV